mgnify:CR=1 FL=1
MPMLDNLKKTALPAGMFMLLSLPQVYGKTNDLFKTGGENCPTFKTRLLHTLAFFVLSYLSVKFYGEKISQNKMVRYALCSALLFFLLSSPELYQLTGSLMGNVNSEFSAKMGQSNCPTLTGVLVHTAAFSLVLSWVMTLKD